MKRYVKRLVVNVLRNLLHVHPWDFDLVKQYRLGGVSFRSSVGNPHLVWRWEDMVSGSKEPETIRWIDERFQPGEVFVDIGACVGNYSIYAAARHKGIKVFAFEPEPNSFVELMKNVRLNDVPVTCFLLPLSDSQEVNFLNTNPIYEKSAADKGFGRSSFIAGESNHQFGRTIGATGKTFVPSTRIGMCSSTLDQIVDAGLMPPPHHVKVDVDGIELKVVRGMRRQIEGPQLKTVLCEITGENRDVTTMRDLFGNYGFECVRTPSGSCGNYIFARAT